MSKIFFCIKKKDFDAYNLALLDLGALICSYRKVQCGICPLNLCCDYLKNYNNSELS